MKTVKNDRIRVTVSDEKWESYRDHAERLVQISANRQNVEQTIRGLVLSDAMSKIGNRSEKELLKDERPSKAEIFEKARLMLRDRYLAEHCKYDLMNVLQRLHAGARLSTGMQIDVDEANAYADGILSPITPEKATKILAPYFGEKEKTSEYRRVLKNTNLRMNPSEYPEKILAEATEILREEVENERKYRSARSDMDGWEIEIIGDMPEQIGMCRFTATQ